MTSTMCGYCFGQTRWSLWPNPTCSAPPQLSGHPVEEEQQFMTLSTPSLSTSNPFLLGLFRTRSIIPSGGRENGKELKEEIAFCPFEIDRTAGIERSLSRKVKETHIFGKFQQSNYMRYLIEWKVALKVALRRDFLYSPGGIMASCDFSDHFFSLSIKDTLLLIHQRSSDCCFLLREFPDDAEYEHFGESIVTLVASQRRNGRKRKKIVVDCQENESEKKKGKKTALFCKHLYGGKVFLLTFFRNSPGAWGRGEAYRDLSAAAVAAEAATAGLGSLANAPQRREKWEFAAFSSSLPPVEAEQLLSTLPLKAS